MRFSLQSLRESTCKNIWHDMLKAGTTIGASVEVPDAVAQRILTACGETSPIAPAPALTPGIQAIPFEQWPMAYQVLAKAAQPEDQGLGDIIERIVGPVGGPKFKLWFKRLIGRDCGCEARKERLNTLYPISSVIAA